MAEIGELSLVPQKDDIGCRIDLPPPHHKMSYFARRPYSDVSKLISLVLVDTSETGIGFTISTYTRKKDGSWHTLMEPKAPLLREYRPDSLEAKAFQCLSSYFDKFNVP